MKMIFESILLDKVQESFLAEKEKLQIETTNPDYQNVIDKLLNTVTFEFYKVI